MEYEAHELSLAFPDMPADQFRRFVADIKANGLNNPIVLFEGKILDGRHRYRACREVGVNPSFRDFMEGNPDESSHGDPVAYVQSENAARRQLTESQLAYSITHPNILEYERRKAKERVESAAVAGGHAKHGSAPAPTGARAEVDTPGRASEKLADKAGVGRRSVERAIKVREKGTQEVNDAVAKGEVTLNMAEKIVQLSPAAQKRVIEAPPENRGEALQEAINRSKAAKARDARKAAPPPPQEPGTPFARKFLSGIERLAMLCAEEGVKDGGAIATKFIEEMDWDAVPLTLQLERAEPVIRALAIIQQARAQKAA